MIKEPKCHRCVEIIQDFEDDEATRRAVIEEIREHLKDAGYHTEYIEAQLLRLL